MPCPSKYRISILNQATNLLPTFKDHPLISRSRLNHVDGWETNDEENNKTATRIIGPDLMRPCKHLSQLQSSRLNWTRIRDDTNAQSERKKHDQTYTRWTYATIKGQIITWTMVSKHNFRGTAQSFHLKYPCRRQTSGTRLSSTTSYWGCLSRLPAKLTSKSVKNMSICKGAPPNFLAVRIH
jgi:hypothetical protein